MQTLLDYFKSYFEFDRFDLEQASSSTTTSNGNDSQLYLDCFCEICKHLDKKSVYGKEFRDLVNETNGIIDQCINYIAVNSPQVKTYLGMQDQDSWKEFLNKPSLSYVLRLLTGLSYEHENIQNEDWTKFNTNFTCYYLSPQLYIITRSLGSPVVECAFRTPITEIKLYFKQFSGKFFD
jgi:hypothetical protein